MAVEKFERALTEAFEKQVYGETPAELYEPIHYIMSLGGKRIRPLLTLMSAGLFRENWQNALPPAMAVEVFHNFTLMHDDIMDQAPLRRGKATVHTRWDTNRAILSGDVMLVAAYELLGRIEERYLKTALLRFNRTAAEVCEGQQLDMLFAEKQVVRKEDYLEMIRLKTSVLVGFAMELGGIAAGADPTTCRALYSIGENLGLGFQQTDDILDVYADPEVFGKQVGGDIIENKKTWLLLRAVEKSEGTAFEVELSGWLSAADMEAKVKGVRGIYDALDIRTEATALAEACFQRAEEELAALAVPRPEQKEYLQTLIHQIRTRKK
ncbi:MAG: polyprenyl synthetase family protein [Leadbetterella sp.]|nr:polyprenyl synthetase family protein [Leadbetterella sp.]